MKLPIPPLLYLVSLGLFGLAGWTVYAMLPLWKDSERRHASEKGGKEAQEGLLRGRGQGPALEWNYAHADWWAAPRNVNLVGKPPPPPEPVGGPEAAPKAPAVELRPLEEIIELVSLVHDGETNGRGGNTYVIVRYKPGADVKPPEWYIRENMSGPASMSAPGPGDRSPAARPSGPGKGNRGGQTLPPPPSATARPPGGISPIPTSMAGRQIMQKVWVVDNGDPRHGNRLWPTFDNIKLVGVSSDAQVAYFVRDLPPPKEGEPAPEPKEESLLKTNMHINPELLEELRRLQGRAEPTSSSSGNTEPSSNPVNTWIDLPETKVVNGVTHISKKDEERFRNLDELLSQFHFDPYSGKSVKGLILRNVDAKLAKILGIAAGEVLIELNGRAVRSRSEALEIGKRDYERGVRTFTTKWLANGAVVERTWQAPDR
ncbi:MAG TPA: hypothetical protein VFD82_13125 [Planctomycetota bacterium]|nr:hypothetical protein [Planctomycetota bacterium]